MVNYDVIGKGFINVYMVFDDNGKVYYQFIDYNEALEYYNNCVISYPNSILYMTQVTQKLLHESK